MEFSFPCFFFCPPYSLLVEHEVFAFGLLFTDLSVLKHISIFSFILVRHPKFCFHFNSCWCWEVKATLFCRETWAQCVWRDAVLVGARHMWTQPQSNFKRWDNGTLTLYCANNSCILLFCFSVLYSAVRSALWELELYKVCNSLHGSQFSFVSISFERRFAAIVISDRCFG